MAKKCTPPDLSALTRGELEGVVLTLWERLEALESKVAKNSRNSSQPPSTDGLRKTNSLREPSGNKPGARPGHKGSTLKRTAEPTETINQPLPRQCTRCHSDLPLTQSVVAERRQVIDVPASAFDVVEYRTLAVTCCCGQAHVSSFPAGVTELVQYGRNVRALAVHLTQVQMLPTDRHISDSPTPNAEVQKIVAQMVAEGYTDIRVNQQQIDANGRRVGIDRPDIQGTINGKRIYYELDTNKSNRGEAHKARILANDPVGEVILIKKD